MLQRFARTILLMVSLVLASAASCLHAAAEKSTDSNTRFEIVGDALLTAGAYDLLATLSDRFGPRMIGTSGHRDSLDFLEQELASLGLETRRQTFDFPGWVRGDAAVRLLTPVERPVRAVALGYVGAAEAIEGELVFVEHAEADQIEPADLTGRVLLLRPNVTLPQAALHALHERGARGALLMNRVAGGQVLARVANHSGQVPPFPLFSITQEEGRWMQRLLEDGHAVRVSLETTSYGIPMTGTNLIATLPGRSDERIVLGGHFDSWDLGQGSIDNGLGVAQIYEVARLLQAHSAPNHHTVELVWFDAEEFGLWGARHYVAKDALENVRAMINLDMVGRPIALNAMGFEGLLPTLDAFNASLGSWSFQQPVANTPWLGSDHHPFILEGVPAITFNAPLDPEDARYYHDLGDTLDKIDPEMLGRASALITLLVHHLANDTGPRVARLTPSETAKLFRDAGLEERMRRAGQWPFEEEPQ